jgi:hypothetical protein
VTEEEQAEQDRRAIREGRRVDRHRLVYRWDLDKTYLRTEFDTIKDLLRTAFETAADKRTVPGAAALLREIRGSDPYGIYIVSGSPTQLRKVLEAKLRLDGIRWDGFVLKPQLTNILRGRFRFVKDQVGYKLAALLETRLDMPADTREYMFGDDAEADAFIYSVFSDLSTGRVDPSILVPVLESAGVYPDVAPQIVRLAGRLPRGGGAERIFIHLDRVSLPSAFDEFGKRVLPFYNYFQPALLLLGDGVLDPLSVLRVAAELVIHHGFTHDALVASYRDLATRGYVGGRVARVLGRYAATVDESLLATTGPVMRRFAEELLDDPVAKLEEPAPIGDTVIDYISLFARDKKRARAAKLRSMGRDPDETEP